MSQGVGDGIDKLPEIVNKVFGEDCFPIGHYVAPVVLQGTGHFGYRYVRAREPLAVPVEHTTDGLVVTEVGERFPIV